MKIKYFALVLLIIVLSGCKTVYKLEIRDKMFKENIYIENDDISYFKDNKFYAIMNGASDFVEYDKKVNSNSANFKHNYKELDYSYSTVLKSCFKAYNVVEKDKYYILSTSKGIKCATEEDSILLDELDIVIKTNHVVKDNNANVKTDKKYEYVWHFDKNNYSDGSIYIKLYKDRYVFNYNNEFLIKVVIISSLLLTIIVTAFIIIRRVKKAEKV